MLWCTYSRLRWHMDIHHCIYVQALAYILNYLYFNFCVPNLCIMSGNTLMCPVCVECLPISMCTHSTQIWYDHWYFLKKIQSGIFFIPNLCRMLAHTYVQAFYKDWVECVYPICVECLHIVISTQIGYINFGILHKLGTFLNFKKCPQFV